MGVSVKRQTVAAKGFNILAEEGRGRSLLLFGHTDTVPRHEAWRTDPFTLTKKSDRLYGLGAWDMKGGIAAILASLDGFEPKNFTLKIAFVADEENFSLGMHTLVKSGWLHGVYGAISPEPGFKYGLKGVTVGRTGRSVYQI